MPLRLLSLSEIGVRNGCRFISYFYTFHLEVYLHHIFGTFCYFSFFLEGAYFESAICFVGEISLSTHALFFILTLFRVMVSLIGDKLMLAR